MKLLRYCLYALPIGMLLFIVSLALTETDWGKANAVLLTGTLMIGAVIFAIAFGIIGVIVRYRFDRRVYKFLYNQDYSRNVARRNAGKFILKVFPPKDNPKK